MQYSIKPIILIHKIDLKISKIVYHSLLDKIRKTKRAKIEKFKFYEDALRGLFGELLLKYALEKYFRIDYEKEIIIDDEFGKPFLMNKQISYNISHSGNWSVIVCSMNNSGVDIERIEKPPYEIMLKNFTLNEIKQIENNDPQVKTEQFYKMWTLKESYIKMIGQGLSIPLDSFSLDIKNKNTVNIKDKNRATTDVHFKLFYPDSGHIMAVCLRNYNKEIVPHKIMFDDLSA